MRRKVGLVQTTEPVTLMRTRAKTVAPSAIDFVLSANVRRKRNQKVKNGSNMCKTKDKTNPTQRGIVH